MADAHFLVTATHPTKQSLHERKIKVRGGPLTGYRTKIRGIGKSGPYVSPTACIEALLEEQGYTDLSIVDVSGEYFTSTSLRERLARFGNENPMFWPLFWTFAAGFLTGFVFYGSTAAERVC